MQERQTAIKTTECRWWLSGEEPCEFCAQYYCVEVEYRCVDCDRPLCPMCAVTTRESGGVVCPECEGSDAAPM